MNQEIKSEPDYLKSFEEKYDIDFISILDENMTSNKKWTEEFCNLYIDEGLSESVKWGTLGDAPSVATQPTLLKSMKDVDGRDLLKILKRMK
jgi:hypothetical protein